MGAKLSGVERLRDPAAWPTGDGRGSQPAADRAARFLDNRHSRKLNVSGCDLAELPPELGLLGAQLGVLMCSDNNLHGLPDELGDLSCLTTIICFNNQIRELTSAALRGPALGVLMCDGNPLEEPWADLLRTEAHSKPEQDALAQKYYLGNWSLRAILVSGRCNQDAILAHARSSGRLTKAARA